MITRYRPRLLKTLSEVVASLGEISEALDFGAGDGYFASHLARLPNVRSVTPVDVVRRAKSLIEPKLYDGKSLPFGDQQFDLVYCVDVLHHCESPEASIDELMRCSRRYLLIKDHTQNSAVDRATLALLDELGNRRFGIASTYRYQAGWCWDEHIQANGWKRLLRIEGLPCHRGPMGWLSNHLQFLALWERPGEP